MESMQITLSDGRPVSIRRARMADLLGVDMLRVQALDVHAMSVLVERITTLTAAEFLDLDLVDDGVPVMEAVGEMLGKSRRTPETSGPSSPPPGAGRRPK